MKICRLGAEFFHADRWTDGRTGMKQLIDAFRNFANSPKNGSPIREWKSVDCTRLDKNEQSVDCTRLDKNEQSVDCTRLDKNEQSVDCTRLDKNEQSGLHSSR